MVKIVYTERWPFKRDENYFTNVVLYKDEQEDETDDGKKADVEPDDSSKRASVELNHLVRKLSDVRINI